MNDFPYAEDHPEHLKANAAYRQMCMALGNAISCWSDVESNMAFLFAMSLNPPNFRAAIETFYAAIGFDTKLRMADVAIRSALVRDANALAKWGTIHNRLKRKAKSRNKLAHGKVLSQVTETQDLQGKPQNIEFVGCWFVPYFGFSRQKQGVPMPEVKEVEPTEKMSEDQLLDLAVDYTQMAIELTRELLGPVGAARGS